MLVDDHPLVRDALTTLIEQNHTMRICGWAACSSEALAFMEKQCPDMALVDISLKGSNGIELIKGMLSLRKGFPILAISMHDENLYAERVFRAGGKGYITKDSESEQILKAITTVLSGKHYFSPTIQSKIYDRLWSGEMGKALNSIDSLTDRELEILQLIGRGIRTGAIASQLKISIKTVETYRSKLKEKLGVQDGAQLVKYAVEWAGRNAL